MLTSLVPFYVNGTLHPEDRGRLDAALASDPELRAELAIALEISGLVKEGGAELAPAVPQWRLRALLARIGGKSPPPLASAPRRRLLPRRDAMAGRRWRMGWKPAFAAAAVLVLVQAGVIAYQSGTRSSYAGLSGPVATPSAAAIILRPAPDARWADVEALLSSRDLTIVGGPHGGDLDIAVGPDAKIDEEIRRLRASPLIEFAGAAS